MIPGRSTGRDAPSDGGGVFACLQPGETGPMRADSEVKRLRADLVSYLQRKGRGAVDAEDVAQEAFARVHRAGHDLAAADARPLLFVIARNIQLDRWKAEGREARRRSPGDLYDLDSGPHAVASEAAAADQHLIGREALAAAAAVIRDLPPKTRDAFLLHRFESLTYRQIASRLGVSVSMVEKHVAEALRRLKAARGD